MKMRTIHIAICCLVSFFGCESYTPPTIRSESAIPSISNEVVFDNENETVIPFVGNNIKNVFIQGSYTNFSSLIGTKIEELTIVCDSENLKDIDLSFINTLRHLKVLCLSNFRFSDLSFLSGLPLQEITLWAEGDKPLSLVKARSMSALKGCPLRYVDLSFFDLDDLAFLEGAPLETLLLSNSKLVKPLDLMTFTNLAAFDAPASGVDIRAIPKSLKHINLRDCKLVFNIECLESFSNLEILELPCYVTNLNICAKLPLRELWAADCRVEDISPLLNVPLKLVNVSRTKVSDLAPVKHVRTVFADGSQVVSLIGMEPCSIERLSMNECPIKSLEGIESLIRLEDLAFKDTAIKDIWRLKSIPTLKHISFTNAEGESVNLYRSHTNSPYWGQVFSK